MVILYLKNILYDEKNYKTLFNNCEIKIELIKNINNKTNYLENIIGLKLCYLKYNNIIDIKIDI